MMLHLLLTVLLFQDGNHIHGENGIRFQPIVAGNQIAVDTFQFVIPDGIFYSAEDSVQHIFKMAGAEFIPNAVGAFYSASGTWDWTVMVQYIPGRFVLAPEIPADSLVEYFSKQNLYTGEPIDQSPTTIIPATYDQDNGMFMMGLHYPPHQVDGEGHDHNYVFIKKLWLTSKGAMVFSMRADKSAFDDDFAVIDDILNSVERTEPFEPLASDENAVEQPLTFLSLIGVNVEIQPQEQAQESPEETSVRRLIFYSLGLALVGVVVLFMAFQLRKDEKPA